LSPGDRDSRLREANYDADIGSAIGSPIGDRQSNQQSAVQSAIGNSNRQPSIAIGNRHSKNRQSEIASRQLTRA
jgi:acetyl-CoA carboxylase alpha subunit